MRDLRIVVGKTEDGSLYVDQVENLSQRLKIELPDNQMDWIEVGQGHKSKPDMEKLGQALFDSIFMGELREAYRKEEGKLNARLAQIKDMGEEEDEEILRLRFITERDLLNDVPLELMCTRISGKPQFLTLDRHLSIVRSLRTTGQDPASRLKLPVRMLVVIANYDCAGIKVEEEYAQLQLALKPVRERDNGLIIKYLGVDDPREANVEAVVDELQAQAREHEPYHIVHFIGHGKLMETPDGDEGVLEFVDSDGKAKSEYASVLAPKIAEAGVIMVGLQACSSAATTADDAFQGVAQQLIDRGVCGVVAMQWPAHENAARTFFSELYSSWLLDNQELDRAVMEARRKVQDVGYELGRNEAWINPVLFMNLATQSLKFPSIEADVSVTEDRGFAQSDWKLLVRKIYSGDVVPFLGAEIGALPAEKKIEIAQDWIAEEAQDGIGEGFPYTPPEEKRDERCEGYLARVAQYLSVFDEPDYPRTKLVSWLYQHRDDYRNLLDDNLKKLASLPISVYATTNYDDLLERAIRSFDKKPKQIVCNWGKGNALRGNGSGALRPYYDLEPTFKATEEEPVVFHFYGLAADDCRESLVLAEDDFLDFLINVSRGDHDSNKGEQFTPWPPQVRTALTSKSLLFLGFGYSELSFRILLKSIKDVIQNSKSPAFVAVQLVPPRPPDQKKIDSLKEYVRTYLSGEAELKKVKVYWGTYQDFMTELWTAWEEAGYGV